MLIRRRAPYDRVMARAVSLETVYAELRRLRAEVARREDVEALLDTPPLLRNAATRRQLAESRLDKRQGRTRTINGV